MLLSFQWKYFIPFWHCSPDLSTLPTADRISNTAAGQASSRASYNSVISQPSVSCQYSIEIGQNGEKELLIT